MSITVLHGTVARFTRTRGFGFIAAHGTDYFFHVSECLTPYPDLTEGDRVTFEAEESPRGPRAVGVEKVEG